MKIIYKFPMETGQTEVRYGGSPRIALVTMQNGAPTVWLEVDTEEDLAVRQFRVFGTGMEIPDGWQHVGSCQDGIFIWHVYYQPLVGEAGNLW